MSEKPSNPSLNKFEAMKGEWRKTPAEVVEHSLNEKFNEACNSLLAALSNSDSSNNELIHKTKQLGLIVSAQYDWQIISGSNSEEMKMISWAGLARTSLENYVAEDPQNRQALLKSAFFDEDLKNVRKIRRITDASVEPAGIYDPESFCAGVALGEIIISDRSSELLNDFQ